MRNINETYYTKEQRESPAYELLQRYDAGRVTRFHTTPTYDAAPKQNIADHSWGVAILCLEITRRLPAPFCTVDLLRAALLHDVAEYWMTDCGAHAKWEYPELAQALANAEASIETAHGLGADLGLWEQEVLKWADGIELYVHSRKKALHGNAAYATVAKNIYGALITRHQESKGSEVSKAAVMLLLELEADLA